MVDFGSDYTLIKLEGVATWSDEKIEEHLKRLHTLQPWILGEIVELRTEQRRRAKAAETARQQAEAEECTCWPTPLKYHFVYFGATEPGSALEYNPDCPQHGNNNKGETNE